MRDICKLYANITSFYIRDLSICGFWNLHGSWKENPPDTKGETVVRNLWLEILEYTIT